MQVPFVDLRPPPELAFELQDAQDRVMKSGTYIGGDEVRAFEEEWADYIGTEYCVATASGTQALRELMQCWKGSYLVGVPENSMPTIDALQDLVAMDLMPVTEYHNMETSVFKGMLVPVHLYGHPADMDDFLAMVIIEDCAQAHGAKYRGKMCGTLADAAAWSFYPTKNLGAYGDAGAVTTDNEEVANELRCQLHVRMDPLQAAFLRTKLPYLDGWNARRKEIAEQYLEGLADVEKINLPVVKEWAEPVWHMFVITTRDRVRLQADLGARGVETKVRYPVGPHNVLSLPIGPHLSDEQVEYVIEAVKTCAS